MIANYDVRIVTTQATPTAVVAATTTWQEFPRLWRSLLDEVWALLRDETTTVYKDGHNVMLYRDGVPNVEVGVVVTASFSPVGRVVPSALPTGRAATTTHRGPPQRLGAAHDAVRAWCAANGHRLAGPSWEIYGDPDPATNELSIDVYWLLGNRCKT
jgi:effector-binding domain-containing protein